MGYTSVAVLHHDHIGEMSRDTGNIGPRMAEAMLRFPGYGPRPAANFGVGAVIAQDHASGTQVVIVHGNTGHRSADAPFDDEAVFRMKEYLERYGYKVVKRRVPRDTNSTVTLATEAEASDAA